MRRAARRFLNFLLATIAGGLLWSLITIGAGIIASAVVATVTDMEKPWQYVLAAGVFLFTIGAVGSLIRLGFLLLPNRWEKALTRRTGRRRTALPTPPSFLFPTPQQQLTNLIEEGTRLRNSIPPRAQDSTGQLAQAMLGYDRDYPARVFEWEARVWRFLSGPMMTQWRGLYTYANRTQPIGLLPGYLDARIAELRTILSRL